MASLLRRGFKTWCENAAMGYRRDLGLGSTDKLDPRVLAQILGISIWTPSSVEGLDAASLECLTLTEGSSWSAVTLKVAGSYLIIHNDSHLPGRINNTLAHEMAHILLKHAPSQVFFSVEGLLMMNHYNPEHEEEAEYFAGALLVPRQALLELLDSGQTDAHCEQHFGVSKELLRQRKNQTGIARQLSYRKTNGI